MKANLFSLIYFARLSRKSESFAPVDEIKKIEKNSFLHYLLCYMLQSKMNIVAIFM
jgi:hypothetical protein